MGRLQGKYRARQRSLEGLYTCAVCTGCKTRPPRKGPILGKGFSKGIGVEALKVRKVAVVAYSAPPYSSGGVASAHFNLFRLLQQEGLEARLFTFGENGRTDSTDVIRRGTPGWIVKFLLKLNSLMFKLIQPGSRAYQTADILKSVIGARRMSREVSKFEPEIVILPDHGAPGLMLKRPKGAKIILVLHHHWSALSRNPVLLRSIRGGNFSQLDARLALKFEEHVLKRVDIVVCPSNFMKKLFAASYYFAGPVEVIPNVLDELLLEEAGSANLHAQLNLNREDFLIYMPSAGHLLKGADFVFEILIKISTRTKRTIGVYIPGEAAPKLINQLADLPDRIRVCLPGQIPYEEHIANVKACSFGISPSLIENYSMALLEAVHCGVPMLAFKTGGNADIIHNGENGYLVAEGDVAALSDLAINLLEPGALLALKKKTFTFSQQHLSSQTALKAYLDLMTSL